MQIHLSLYASLHRYLPNPKGELPKTIEIEPGTTVRSLLIRLQVPLETVKIIFLNGILSKGDDILKDGDRLGVFPPIAGG